MNKQKILIVDDEKKNIRLFKAMLMSENYQIFEALNGEQALQTVSAVNPDMILLDVMMPGIDGFSVCRKLKQAEETKIIPIVVVTALSDKEHRLKALEVGADDFLSKPVDHTELLVRVKSLLRIKTYHDELLASHREIAVKNERLIELEKTKEGLTHMIIHDLKTPLSMIIGIIDLFLLKDPPISQDQRDSMTTCLHYSRDLIEMIQSLLDIHRLEDGKLKPDFESTDIAKIIQETMEQTDFKARENQVLLSANASEKAWMAEIDRNLIKRVLLNLLSNAIRHTPAGGSVEVKADLLNTKEEIQFRVIDTGNGLAPEYHQKVFDKFEQVRLKQDGITIGSSGLGLAFCKMAVEAHGGEIWVESEGEGSGSTFQFTLPVKQMTRG